MNSGRVIIDEFTDLPVSRQRKWQLRHPKEAREIQRRLRKTLKYQVYHREEQREKLGSKVRYMGAKSYQKEAKKK